MTIPAGYVAGTNGWMSLPTWKAADANRIAQTWILDQIRQGSLSPVDGANVEVLPVMI